MTRLLLALGTSLSAIVMITVALGLSNAKAAPSAEVAKRCLHYAYIAYPFKRPGAVHMSGDREAYFRDCLTKDGDVPAPKPVPPKS